MHALYILISRRNPGSVDQPWITRRNAGLFASENPGSTSDHTLDHWRFGPRAAGHILPRTFDKLMWRSLVPHHWCDRLQTRDSDSLSKRVKPRLRWQIQQHHKT